ncbi:MAG TPA: hypothetical protein VK586_23385 [Streptosporangiaceae bacterium]|nr:hypothetical protein [Streptosporangiaceae bacterium]
MAINGGLAVPPELAVSVERYAVYRCYGDDGQLLYVGETGELGTRLASHAQKLWFTQVRGITLEWYVDELDALNAERRAIHVEHPKYNVIHRNSAAMPAPSPPRPPMPVPVRRAPIKRGARKARVSPEDAREAADAILAAEPGITGAELARRVGMSERWGAGAQEAVGRAHAQRDGVGGASIDRDGEVLIRAARQTFFTS